MNNFTDFWVETTPVYDADGEGSYHSYDEHKFFATNTETGEETQLTFDEAVEAGFLNDDGDVFDENGNKLYNLYGYGYA